MKAQSVGAEDNFFELGGDSLAVIQVQTAILKYGFEIGTQDFYALQTLASICARIDKKLETEEKPITEVERFALAQKNARVPLAGEDLRPADLSCVLLTGANGYLGAHVLSELAGLYNSRVYCIMRANNDEKALQKLRDSLVFYFGESGAERHLENVRVVCGDITQPAFGVPDDLRIEIVQNVRTVIHCAALTSHYGMSETFEKANVLGTEYVAGFCKEEKKPLLHVSTMSVSGTRVPRMPDRIFEFDEGSYHIGQDYSDNEYRKSKFLAEGILLKARGEGLDVRIFRVGNLTARSGRRDVSEGKGQQCLCQPFKICI